jgi:ribulose-phosphate 3-epimerase
MMAKIIPAILAQDAIEFAQKLRLVESSVDTVHIDVTDGKFVPYKNWADPEVVKTIPTKVNYELHLMVCDVAGELAAWKKIENVKRAIFHIEVKKNHIRLVQSIKKNGWQVGVALNPRTSIKRIEKILPLVDAVLFLGVTPGRSGQKFQSQILAKIKALKKNHPHITIEVDGGVKLSNARQIKDAGADALCAASVIYKNKKPKKIINDLKKLI